MKFFSKKNLLYTMTILLLLSFVISMFAVPDVNAQSTREIVTWPFVDAIPKVAGVGQPVLINRGLINYLNNVNDGWNVTLQITYPSGKVENITSKTWSTGSVGTKMAFMEPGNYTLQTFFNGETYTWRNAQGQTMGGYFKPSSSAPFTLQIVENYWKMDHPGHTLPAEYWTRPVDSQLREWYSLMGSWLGGNRNLGPNGVSRFAPYNEGPESAHILWSMPMDSSNGGLAGGETGTIGFQIGDAYEGKFYDAVIVAGVLYYNREYGSTSGSSTPLSSQSVIAIDLHTGKVLWERNYANVGNGRIARGQIMTFVSENNRGAWSYLWIVQGTNMWALDAKNGELRYNMTNVPAGDIYYGPSGEMLKYQITGSVATGFRLLQWNSTHVVLGSVSGGVSDAWGSNVNPPDRTTGATRSFDGAVYDINVSISGLTASPGTLRTAFPDNRVIFATDPSTTDGFVLTAISLNPENLGYLYFSRKFTPPAEWADFDFSYASQNTWSTFDEQEMIGIFWTNKDRVYNAFSLETGKHLWTTEPRVYSDSWAGSRSQIAYGHLYAASGGGTVYCWDIKSGELLWTYEATDKYNESYHGENWWLSILFVTDGKLYCGHSVHSPQVPLPRGAPFLCLNATDGTVIWEIDGAFRQTDWGGKAMIGDSIIATMDTYDGQIYAIGKGPSSMTVSVSNAVATAGSPVLVSGTVMDVSPGTESDNLRMRFPNGVPAVGDESMSDWMLYLYKHFAQPMNVKGIDITVYAYDGEDVIPIGTTKSDARGRFSITWTPPSEGEYDIWAYFEGTASYYGSDAKAEMAVFAAPEAPQPEKTPPYEWYLVGGFIATILTVLLVGVWIKKK